ncbi:hypothetical protein Csp2054_09045 [Curtobacterium sp. 'Ferrero']|uniref:hypothetical protein n=1 Tax=Curtobacterium sp. 'Ferrero' TaxID=2033654 RepID=UPI000BC37708|nr:hypothetical protein [Curtobacterium sp. 'Ferrero']PCN48009.1 hypothetical protein Csp2054_09045 [Curtobacterium sp. 'Ferrero']
MSAAWAPMMAPPLPLRNDAERNTCPHAYPDEDCLGGVTHIDDSGDVYYAALTPEERARGEFDQAAYLDHLRRVAAAFHVR